MSSAAGGTGEAVDIRISDDGYTMSDIELLCSEVGKGDEDKDQEVVQAVLSVSIITCSAWHSSLTLMLHSQTIS